MGFSAPVSFFASTDTGVMMNRFSEDMQLFDMGLPMAALNTTICELFPF